jgi:preprotein translocase subunit YajC
MNTLFAASSGGGGIQLIVLMVLVFGFFWFIAIRPQNKQRRAHKEMLSMLKKGDEVITIGGMFGTIKKIGPDWVDLEIASRTRVRYLKRAISSIVSEEDEDLEEESEEEVDDSDDSATEIEAESTDSAEIDAEADDTETDKA